MFPLYISAIESGDEKDKFEELYHRYSRLMQYVADSILHDPFLAEDAVHTAFLKIIDNLGKINDVTCHKTKAFVVIVVENVAKGMYVDRKKQATVPFDKVEYSIAAESGELEELMSDIGLEEIAAKIEMLSELDSEILMMRYIHELNDKEISRLLDVKEATARKRLERARRRLAALLEKEGEDYGK